MTFGDFTDIPLDLMKLVVVVSVSVAACLLLLLVIMLAIRKKITKNDPPEDVFEDPFMNPKDKLQ